MAKVTINGNSGANQLGLVDRIRARIDKKKIWEFVKTLKIELVFAFYAIPGYLCIIALLSLPLDKVIKSANCELENLEISFVYTALRPQKKSHANNKIKTEKKVVEQEKLERKKYEILIMQ